MIGSTIASLVTVHIRMTSHSSLSVRPASHERCELTPDTPSSTASVATESGGLRARPHLRCDPMSPEFATTMSPPLISQLILVVKNWERKLSEQYKDRTIWKSSVAPRPENEKQPKQPKLSVWLTKPMHRRHQPAEADRRKLAEVRVRPPLRQRHEIEPGEVLTQNRESVEFGRTPELILRTQWTGPTSTSAAWCASSGSAVSAGIDSPFESYMFVGGMLQHR